jgi:hypothetical protein
MLITFISPMPLLVIFITTSSKNISKIRTLTYYLQSFLRGQFGLKSGPSLIIVMTSMIFWSTQKLQQATLATYCFYTIKVL